MSVVVDADSVVQAGLPEALQSIYDRHQETTRDLDASNSPILLVALVHALLPSNFSVFLLVRILLGRLE